jgi:alpha-glucoside transport system substrate-binding protein
MKRRALLLGAAGALASTGCLGAGRTIQVAVLWSGDELAQFRAAVKGYERSRNRRVDVISAGDGIDAFLRARARTGNLPDMAIMPMPGLIAEYARRGWLDPVPAEVPDRFRPAWNNLLTVDGQQYGAWVKGAHKSLFWYLDGTLADPPQTWDDLVNRVTDLAGSGGPAPLAIGAADGWVLTDWLENLLAALSPGQYQQLVDPRTDWRASQVPEALNRLGRLWRIPGAFPSGPRRALLTQMGESVLDVVAHRSAVMVFEGDFVTGYATGYQRGDRLRVFRFPALDGVRPLVVGGDAAVVFRGSPAGADLLTWLTDGVGPFRRWIDSGGYLSPNLKIDVREYPSGLTQRLAAELTDQNEVLRFDLSDQLPGALGGSDGVGMWRILQDFFEAVAVNGQDLTRAVDRALDALVVTAGAARQAG